MQIVAGDQQSAQVGTQLPTALVARVVDAQGRPVRGQAVNFRVTSGGGSVFAGVANSDDSGVVRELWTLGTSTADSQRVEARAVDNATGAPLTFATFKATALSGPAAAVSLAAPRTLLRGPTDTIRMVATVHDQYGNTVPPSTIVWSSSDTSVAVVANGLVQWRGFGLDTIVAVAGSARASQELVVHVLVSAWQQGLYSSWFGWSDGLITSTFAGNQYHDWLPDNRTDLYTYGFTMFRRDTLLGIVDSMQVGDSNFPPERVSPSPDGQRVVMSLYGIGVHAGDSTLVVRRWGAAGGDTIARGAVAAWSPRGDRIAFMRWDSVVVVDTLGGDRRVVRRADRRVGPVWSPDGARLAISNGGNVEVVDAALGTTIAVYPMRGVPTSFSPDGRWLYFTPDNNTDGGLLWRVGTQRVLTVTPSRTGPGITNTVRMFFRR